GGRVQEGGAQDGGAPDWCGEGCSKWGVGELGGDEGKADSATSTKRSRGRPACQTILNAIGNLLADGRQVEEFLFAEDICGFFGKLPIRRRLVPKVIIPIHAWHCA